MLLTSIVESVTFIKHGNEPRCSFQKGFVGIRAQWGECILALPGCAVSIKLAFFGLCGYPDGMLQRGI